MYIKPVLVVLVAVMMSGCAYVSKKNFESYVHGPDNILVNVALPFLVVDACGSSGKFDLECTTEKYTIKTARVSDTQNFKVT